MNGQPPNIDAIVAEVVARLRRMFESAPAPPAPPDPPAVLPPPAATAAPVPPPAPPQPPRNQDPAQGDVFIGQRVVTLQLLEGQLDRARRLVLTPGAVLTPSVKDELRKRRVRVEYQEASPVASELLVICCTRSPQAARLAAQWVTAVSDARVVSIQQLSIAAQELAGWVNQDQRLGVLVTDDPISGVCLANRAAAVRAAWPRRVPEVASAVSAIGANALVVDPQSVPLRDFVRMMETFRQGLPRRAPTNWDSVRD